MMYIYQDTSFLTKTHIIPGDVDSSAPGVGPPCLLVEAFPSVGIKRPVVKPMQRDIQETEREKNSGDTVELTFLRFII